MTTSDWITVLGIATGLFAATIGSTLLLVFKIEATHEKVLAVEKTLAWVTQTLEKITSKKKYRKSNSR